MPREILKVTRKGQVTIPKKYRDALNIKEGDIICASLEGDKIVLMKLGIPEPGDPVGEEEYRSLIKLLEEERKAWR
ncbi:MAG: AbrB/MazE/SpoVT family DNA-binding domain-containing protein [archaeon YNP-WB-040]|jgi:AbrB family looped-hinge helix DNA binding protein|nr:AbrB/MazE/SpoVT family DNA-binding domain-containing protein [Candidatus Culexarchaeum yellowstonense]